MRAIIQRVSASWVEVDGQVVGRIGRGLNVLLGVGPEDSPATAAKLLDKILGVRIFADPQGKMNLSLRDISGELLVISQFTLYADTNRGRRPSFTGSAPPELANQLYEHFVQLSREQGIKTETGVFGAMMQVHIENDGPVTLWLEC